MAGLGCGLGMGGAALSPPLSPLPRAGAFPATFLAAFHDAFNDAFTDTLAAGSLRHHLRDFVRCLLCFRLGPCWILDASAPPEGFLEASHETPPASLLVPCRVSCKRPVAAGGPAGPWKAGRCDRSFAAAGARGVPAIHRERRHAPDRPQTLFGVPDGPFLLPSGTDDVISCAESMVSVPDELQEKIFSTLFRHFPKPIHHLISVAQKALPCNISC